MAEGLKINHPGGQQIIYDYSLNNAQVFITSNLRGELEMRMKNTLGLDIKYSGFLVGILLLLVGCVSDYEPGDLEQVKDPLVVDGIITNGETTISLRRSVGLKDKFTENEFVNNAKVTVERQDGSSFTGIHVSNKGEYKVDMGGLGSFAAIPTTDRT